MESMMELAFMQKFVQDLRRKIAAMGRRIEAWESSGRLLLKAFDPPSKLSDELIRPEMDAIRFLLTMADCVNEVDRMKADREQLRAVILWRVHHCACALDSSYCANCETMRSAVARHGG